MNKSAINLLRLLCLLFIFALHSQSGLAQKALAPQPRTEPKMAVASGLHSWYEVKVDPEDARNLIVCGSRWDINQNALFGFVYASSDAGKTWRKTLEDKSSTWVSEHSCAFGPKHMAYFISEATKVVDGKGQPHQGRMRLFTSKDAGQHWAGMANTAFGHWTTSAVSPVTGKLLTFFNYVDTIDQSKNWGNSVGLLAFSADGKSVSGPFINPAMKERNYRGVFPSTSLALRDGAVVVLYAGLRDTPTGPVPELGLERVEPASSPSPTFSVVVTANHQSKWSCLADYSLAYDEKQNRLSAVYGEDSGGACCLTLATSMDGGKIWTKGAPVAALKREYNERFHPSIAFGADGQLGLLWTQAGDWFFSLLKDAALAGPPIQLHARPAITGIISDSLMTYFTQAYQMSGYYQPEDPVHAVVINIRTQPGAVWRANGLVASGNRFHAVFLGVDGERDQLYSVTLPAEANGAVDPPAAKEAAEVDVTNRVALLYGRAQSFDNATGTLSVEVRLANRGDKPIRTPIRLEVKSISSKVGKVTVLNADNDLTGPGARWDLSRSVAGDQIPPGAASYNTFTLQFHIALERPGLVSTNDLLNLSARVLARVDGPSQTPAGGQQ